MPPRLCCALLALATVSLRAQDTAHIEPDAEKPASAASPAQAKGRGRGVGGGGGARGGNAAESIDLNQIIANPSDLEKGRGLFEVHCVGCHGPKGEGVRGPTLAQPRLPRANNDLNLVHIVERGIPGTEMPAVRLRTGEAPYLAAYVKSLGRIPVEPVPGNPAKGAELFKTKGACMACHTLHGEGLAIGPDLTEIGQRRSPTFLRRSLVDPGAEVPQSFVLFSTEISMPLNFLFVRVKTKEGREVAGVRINETTFSIQLRDLTGAIHSFHKSELAELHKDKGVSPMPVYAGVFTPTEMDDVVAYLVSLRGEEK